VPAGRGRFPPLQRAEIVSLACSPPAERGSLLVRWTVRDLQIEIVAAGIVTEIHFSTVSLILSTAELRPHRTKYWLHSQDPAFEEKAASILWFYERAQWLASRGILVVCIDEKTGMQALGRKHADIPAAPGRDRRREFEYVRHGSVSLQLAHCVPTGELTGRVIPKNDSLNFIETLELLDEKYKDARRIELILDNGSSHTSKATREWLLTHSKRFAAHYTPTHASWLNQAEMALSSFTRKYTKGLVVAERQQLVDRIHAGIPDYNKRYAHPFDWSSLATQCTIGTNIGSVPRLRRRGSSLGSCGPTSHDTALVRDFSVRGGPSALHVCPG